MDVPAVLVAIAFMAGGIAGFVGLGIFVTSRRADESVAVQAHAFEYALLRSIAKADAVIEDELSQIRGARLVGDEASSGTYLEHERERRMLLRTWRSRFATPRQVA